MTLLDHLNCNGNTPAGRAALLDELGRRIHAASAPPAPMILAALCRVLARVERDQATLADAYATGLRDGKAAALAARGMVTIQVDDKFRAELARMQVECGGGR
jgi:hypothetical protein